MRRIQLPTLVLILSLLATLSIAGAPAMAAAEESECPLKLQGSSGEPEAPAVDPPIELQTPQQSDQVLNFGDGRGIKSDLITIKASDPLPKTVQPDHFQLIPEQPMKRIGSDNLESTRLQPLTYSKPEIVSNRQRIKFNICVNAEDGKPGTYTGQILLSGPPGITSTTITQTAQLKTREWPFLLFLAVALALAGLLLLWKTGIDLKKKKPKTRRNARIAIVLGSLISMGGAMYAAYNSNPAWGADLYASIAAVVGTGLAAAGLGSTVSGAVQQIADDA